MRKQNPPLAQAERLGAAAADLDGEEMAAAQRLVTPQQRLDAQIGQAVDFRFIHDVDGDVGGDVEAIEKRVAVGGLAHRTGGHRAHPLRRFDPVLAQHAPETVQSLHALLDRLVANPAARETVLAQADGLLKRFERAKPALRQNFRDRHANRCRSDVDRRDGSRPPRRPADVPLAHGVSSIVCRAQAAAPSAVAESPSFAAATR